MLLLRGDGGVLVVGHRGAAALARGNTLAAIEAAAAHGADAVELDVLRGPRGTLVLAHGPDVPLDAPTLADGLARAARLGLAVQLDVKTPGLERDLVAALRAAGLVERSFVSSPSLAVLRGLAAVEPKLSRSFSYPDDRHGLGERRLLRPVVATGLLVLRAFLPLRLPRWLAAAAAHAATLNASVVSPRALAACHRRGVAVLAWTVNDPSSAKTLVESGIDGIITDDPRLLRAPGSVTA